MHQTPQDGLRRLYRFGDDDAPLDNQTASRLKKELAAEFRGQLTCGVPINADEAGLLTAAPPIARAEPGAFFLLLSQVLGLIALPWVAPMLAAARIHSRVKP